MTTTSWNRASQIFDKNVESVLELLRFDRLIIETAVSGLRDVAAAVEEKHALRNVARTINNRADMLENVQRGDSLRPKYETMFNQCVVLLVSYFDSAVHDAFRSGVMTALRTNANVPVTAETLSVSWRALEHAEDDRERIFADLLVTQKNISFQDMKSIVRAFDQSLGITLERTVHTDNIIVGQAARHAIVHAASIADQRMIHQMSGAKLRTVKTTICADQRLHFLPEEIEQLAASMTSYMASLCAALDLKFLQTSGLQ